MGVGGFGGGLNCELLTYGEWPPLWTDVDMLYVDVLDECVDEVLDVAWTKGGCSFSEFPGRLVLELRLGGCSGGLKGWRGGCSAS